MAVVEANAKLYINRQEGFIDTALKKDEYVCNCSDIDDIIIFYKDGKYKVIKVADKIFVGKNILHVGVFKKNDQRTIYNVVYRDGKKGFYFIKRFNVTSVTRDREYDLTQGTPGSKVVYFTANPDGEAEIIKVTLEPAEVKKGSIFLDKDFSQILIKGRSSKGNLLTKKSIHRIGLKSHGHSTLGGRKVWFDPDVNRLNYDEHGTLLGEFFDDDQILVILNNGDYYLTNFDANNHYEDNIAIIEKYDEHKVWTAVLYDADNAGYPYMKRFEMEATKRKQNYLGENTASKQILLTCQPYPVVKVFFGGNDSFREPIVIEAEQFIAVKGFKAKGKRITTWQIENIELLPPSPDAYESLDSADASDSASSVSDASADSDSASAPSSAVPGSSASASPLPEENLDPDAGKSERQVRDEILGQLNLFPDDI